MKWDKGEKKRLCNIIEAKLKEICSCGVSMAEAAVMLNANPNLTMDDILEIEMGRFSEGIRLRKQFFDDFGILLGLPKAAKAKKYVTLDVFMPLAIKATKIRIHKDIAEKFFVLGIP